MKYALVTGATKGIGRAVTELLLEKGWFVFANYAHDEKTAAELLQSSENIVLIKADMSRIESVSYIKDEILKKAAGLDAVILNAGGTDYDAFGRITWENWITIMNINLNIPFFLVQELREQIFYGGTVTAIASVLGKYPHARSISYGVSKAGIGYLMKMLVKEFGERGIRTNAVNAGFTDTEWQKEKSEELRNKIAGKIALKRFAKPKEIADIVWSVISNTYINGSVIDVNGGYDFV